MEINNMMGTTTFDTAMTFRGFVSAVVKTVKVIEKHVVKNVMGIYLTKTKNCFEAFYK